MRGRSARRGNRHRRRPGDAIGGAVATTMAGHVPPTTLAEMIRRADPLASSAEAAATAARLRADAIGLGIVDRLLAGPEVNEIMINGAGRIWIEQAGRIEPVADRLEPAELDVIIERMLSPLGLRLDRLNPIVDARLPDGSRVNVVARPLAVDGPVLSVRRFGDRRLPLASFGPPDLVALLDGLVRARSSILVVGATSSGKTTLLNSLSELMDPDERIVTIEDTAELRLAGRHVVRLEARPANSEGVGLVSMRQLVTTALRLRPDRLVVGEVRGAEALDLLLALTAGHAGSLCTCHALGPHAGLRRLHMLAGLADGGPPPDLIRSYVLDAIDVVVHVDRRPDGERGVQSVWAVVKPDSPSPSGAVDGLTLLWRRRPSPGGTGVEPRRRS